MKCDCRLSMELIEYHYVSKNRNLNELNSSTVQVYNWLIPNLQNMNVEYTMRKQHYMELYSTGISFMMGVKLKSLQLDRYSPYSSQLS